MEATAKRRTRRRSPYLGSPCRACGHDTLVTSCTRPGCDQWLSVCGGCLDEIDRSYQDALAILAKLNPRPGASTRWKSAY